MDKLDMFQSRFGKIDKFVWWDLEIISADADTQFTLVKFKEKGQTCGVNLTLAAPLHQEINRQVKVTWRMLRTILHSLMVHARFSETYIHFKFMYTPYHTFPVLPIKDLINKDGNPTMTFKLVIGTNSSVSHLRVLYFHVLYRKLLNTLTKRR